MVYLELYKAIDWALSMENFLQILIFLTGFIIIAVASNQISKLFLRIKLPLVTGLLFMGIIAGPYVLDLIPREAIANLDFVNDFALAFIAFTVGAELYLRELRNRFRSITGMTLGQLIVTFILGSLAVYFIAEYIPFMQGMNTKSKVAVSLLAGTIFVARSPASIIAVVHEMRAKGPFTQTAIGVTVLTDFLVIILFTVILSIGEGLINGTSFNLIFIFLLIFDLLFAFILGYGLSKLIGFIIFLKTKAIVKTILILLAGYGIFTLSHYLREWSLLYFNYEIFIEPLLICIIASFIITNYSKHQDEFLKILHDSRTAVYVIFFTLIGASISLGILATVWSIAIALFVIRLVALVIAGFVGGSLGGDPARLNRIAWMPYVTQAGVSLGLTAAVAGEFIGWGTDFATIIVAVIVLNQIVGPPIFKWAINLAGEGHGRAVAPELVSMRSALIFGLESQSLALARQLQEHHWDVKMATLKSDIGDMKTSGINIHRISDLSVECMQELDASKAETIVTMLSDDENFQICELAFEHFGTKEIVVRLHDRNNFDRFHELGALIVEPSTAIVSLLDHFVRSPQATSLLLGMEENQDTVTLEVQNPNLHKMALRNLHLPHDIIILSVTRKGQMIISHGYTRLRKKDIVTLVGSSESLENVRLRFEE
ncbi:MAG TPA: potassium transporter TrkA [Bacteroides sp.]|nr:potassium transporter TrkA [Bacteroides sp.]